MFSFYFIGFSTGIVSSLHCVGMCGPLALALPIGKIPKKQAFFAKILYNLGRISTYSILGLVFGLLGKGIALFHIQQMLSIVLGIILLLIFVLKIYKISLPQFQFIHSFIKSTIAKNISPKSLIGFYIFGIVNGLLPCAMIYLALAGSVISSTAIDGMIYMLAFGLGTSPAMFFLLQISRKLKNNHSTILRKLSTTFSLTFAILLIIRGLNLGIPYISPLVAENAEKQAITVCHGR